MTGWLPGDRVGDFEITSAHAPGKQQTAYEAKDTTLGRTVILQLFQSADRAHAISRIDHPNIGPIYRVDETADGEHFIVAPRHAGESVRARSLRTGMHPRAVFNVAEQVATALAAAHAAGVTHGNVSADSIFLTSDGLVKLIDFASATPLSSPAADVRALANVAGELIDRRQIPSTARATLKRMLTADMQPEPADAFARELAAVNRTWTRRRSTLLGSAALLLLIIAAGFGLRRISALSTTDQVPTLGIVEVTGNTADRETVGLVSALQNEIAARLVALKRVKLVRIQTSPAASTRYVLKLAMDSSSSRPTVAISLTDSRNARTILSDRRVFERDNLREIGRDLVIGVLASLGRPATADERRIIGAGFPASAEAYEEFLTGNQDLARRSPASVESALLHYRRSTELDSTFAAGFARQAYSYAVLADWGWKPSSSLPQDMLKEGLALADRATTMDSTSADAWLARAYILRHKDPRRFAGAVNAFEQAITLDPYNAEAFHQYGQTLMALGREAEAAAAYRRSLDLEPNRATELVPLAAIEEREGRLSEGTRLLDSAVAAAPQVGYVRAMRSMFRSQAGDLSGARDDAMRALSLDSTYRIPPLSALARALWLSGDTAAARSRVADAERSISNVAAPDPTEAFWLALAEVATHQPEKAVELLRRSQPRGAWLWFYFGAADLAQFRKRSDVSALLAAMDPRGSAPRE